MGRKFLDRRAPSPTRRRAEGQQVGNGLVAVVGVGASAGGLEAFKQLLKRLPVDTGMAFVLVAPRPEAREHPARVAGKATRCR